MISPGDAELDRHAAGRFGHRRALVVIAAALVVLAASIFHVLAPTGTPHVTSTRVVSLAKTPVPIPKRPYGVLHMDGVDIPAPEMHAFERSFIQTLTSMGFSVQRVEASAWDVQLDQADADNLSTNHGVVTVVAPYDVSHPLWMCSRGIAAVNGADVPTYEISAGGVRINVQVPGQVFFGRADDVLVMTQDEGLWGRLSSIATTTNCPG